MANDQLSGAFHYGRDPLNPLDRVLALQDPHSFEYKILMDFLAEQHQADIEKHELLCQEFLLKLLQSSKEEEERVKQSLKEEKPGAVDKLNAEVRAEHQQTAAKTAVEKQHHRIEELKSLQQEHAKVQGELGIVNQKISNMETSWKAELTKSADKFINDNFTTNENGKLVSKKNPQIELLAGADKVIQQIYQDAKSPADMVKHNPHLKDNPERMMVVDDVRKEVKMAKKIDKLVAKDARDAANKDRKIIVKRAVKDAEGNLVYETDASGKRKVKTERVELTPETTKLKDAQATDESTKKKKAQLVCLGDVCFLKNEVIVSPITHTAEQTALAENLLSAGQERINLQARAAELESKMKGMQQAAAPLKAEENPPQVLLEKDAAAAEKEADIPEPPPPPPPPPRIR